MKSALSNVVSLDHTRFYHEAVNNKCDPWKTTSTSTIRNFSASFKTVCVIFCDDSKDPLNSIVSGSGRKRPCAYFSRTASSRTANPLSERPHGPIGTLHTSAFNPAVLHLERMHKQNLKRYQPAAAFSVPQQLQPLWQQQKQHAGSSIGSKTAVISLLLLTGADFSGKKGFLCNPKRPAKKRELPFSSGFILFVFFFSKKPSM